MREEYVSPRRGMWYAGFMSRQEGKEVIVYDLETTGLKPRGGDRIIQLSARKCRVQNGRLVQMDAGSWYINPGFLISARIEELTGITNEFLADKPNERDVFQEIKEFLKTYPVIGYNNGRFDDIYMSELYKRMGCEFLPEESADCFTFVKAVMKPGEVQNQKLATITSYFGMEAEVGRFHNADGDTMATMLVFNELMDRIDATKDQAIKEGLIKCKVMRIARWESFRSSRLKRIYVETSRAKFFLDCVTKKWYLDDEHDRIQRYDVEGVINQAMEATKCNDETELARWKGPTWYVDVA